MSYHPIFGILAADPLFLSPEECAERDVERRITEIATRRRREDDERKAVYFQQLLDFEIDGIGVRPDLPAPPYEPAIARAPRALTSVKQELFRPETRIDADGIKWDLQDPGTPPQAGDVDDGDGLWRPNRTPAQCDSRYDRAVLARIEAERHLAEAIQLHGEGDRRATAARNRVNAAWAAQAKALKDADDPAMKAREAIDAHRKTEDGKAKYNADRRTRATPNRDLSGLSEQAKADHIREREREKKRRQRAAAKAAKEAAK